MYSGGRCRRPSSFVVSPGTGVLETWMSGVEDGAEVAWAVMVGDGDAVAVGSTVAGSVGGKGDGDLWVGDDVAVSVVGEEGGEGVSVAVLVAVGVGGFVVGVAVGGRVVDVVGWWVGGAVASGLAAPPPPGPQI
jgi:hypothetical protein